MWHKKHIIYNILIVDNGYFPARTQSQTVWHNESLHSYLPILNKDETIHCVTQCLTVFLLETQYFLEFLMAVIVVCKCYIAMCIDNICNNYVLNIIFVSTNTYLIFLVFLQKELNEMARLFCPCDNYTWTFIFVTLRLTYNHNLNLEDASKTAVQTRTIDVI